MRPYRAWLSAIRPKTLGLSVTPVLVGTALAWADGAPFSPGPAAAALGAALCIQAGTNLHNDAADHQSGLDTAARLGPPRACAQGWLRPESVLRAAYLAFGLAFLLGVYLAWVGGWPIVAVGLAALAAAWSYSGGARPGAEGEGPCSAGIDPAEGMPPPDFDARALASASAAAPRAARKALLRAPAVRPIAYGPWGELFVLAFFGLAAVGGSHYLQSGALAPSALAAGAALGMIAAAVLATNNYRDRENDARAGRRTLVILLGPHRGRQLYPALLLAAYALLFLLLPRYPAATGLAFLTLPWALVLVRRHYRETGVALNRLLADTARLQVAFGVLLAIGFLLSR